MRGGLFLPGPLAFTALRLLPYALPEEKEDETPRRKSFFHGVRFFEPSREEENNRSPRECSALAGYQMGCFAHHLSVGGLDVAATLACPCERSGGRCIDRLR